MREAFRGSSELVRGRWWHTRPRRRLPLAAQRRHRPGARLRPDLHQLLAALDQPASARSSSPCSSPTSRSATRSSTSTCGARGRAGAGEAAALLAPWRSAPGRRREPKPRPATPRADRFGGVKLLAFSDLHRDLGQARRAGRDVGRRRRRDRRRRLRLGPRGAGGDDRRRWRRSRRRPSSSPATTRPTSALREAPRPSWGAATVLHGEGTTIDGVEFFGLGAGIPVTPWDWSFDLDDEAATGDARALPRGRRPRPPLAAARATATPTADGDHFGSPALLRGDRGQAAARSRSAATSTSPGAARAGSARRRSATSARPAPGSRSRPARWNRAAPSAPGSSSAR